MSPKQNAVLDGLRIAYLSALLVLAGLSILGYLIPQREYRNQQSNNAVFRAIRRQELLLEQASFLACRLATVRASKERQEFREKLSSTVNELEASHLAFLAGDPQSTLESIPPASVRAIYFESPFVLDSQIRQFITEVRKIINAPNAELNENNPHLTVIGTAEARLPVAIGEVARQYQEKDKSGLLFLQHQEIGMLVATLLPLLLIGLFLFRPMVRRIQREQESLLESERRMTTLVNNLPGAAYRLPLDHSKPMAFVSEGIFKLTEYQPEVFVGPSARPFVSLIVPADGPAVKIAIQEAINRDQPYVMEYRIRTRTGKEKWLWEKGICVRDDAGKQVAMEGFLEDITQWKRSEEARVQAERLAAIGSMSAKLAHEIRNPLGTIKLNLDLLGDEIGALGPGSSTTTEESKVLLQALGLEVRRIQLVADDYLQFGRMRTLHREPVSLNELANRELSFMAPLFKSSQVQVRTEFEPSPPHLQADADQLWQAILNLIRNAVEAMPNGGTLTLRTASDDNEVVLHLADTGEGMRAEEQAQIFRPFFTTKQLGTGLGLTLTQQIISEHGGHIECASVLGQGTTFSVYFPLRVEFSEAHES